jgi:hypothetical protein
MKLLLVIVSRGRFYLAAALRLQVSGLKLQAPGFKLLASLCSLQLTADG